MVGSVDVAQALLPAGSRLLSTLFAGTSLSAEMSGHAPPRTGEDEKQASRGVGGAPWARQAESLRHVCIRTFRSDFRGSLGGRASAPMSRGGPGGHPDTRVCATAMPYASP